METLVLKLQPHLIEFQLKLPDDILNINNVYNKKVIGGGYCYDDACCSAALVGGSTPLTDMGKYLSSVS